jgi:hypothetical protein
MTPPTISIQPTNEEAQAFDPEACWKLRERSRFPTSLEEWEWDRFIRLPQLPKPRVVGQNNYDLIVNRKARRPVTLAVGRLIAAFPQDFAEASDWFHPIHWRLLYWLDLYPIAALGWPDFNVTQVLRDICDQNPWTADVPREWIGAREPAADILPDVRVRICQMRADTAKAAWAILSLARRMGMEKNEVLQVPWWQCWWIERYLNAVVY